MLSEAEAASTGGMFTATNNFLLAFKSMCPCVSATLQKTYWASKMGDMRGRRSCQVWVMLRDFFLPLSCLQLGLTFSPLFSQCHNEFTDFSELPLFDGENKNISVLVTCHSLFILCRITRLVLPCFLIFIFHTVELNYIRNKRKRSPSFAFRSLSTFIFMKLKGPSS